MKEKKRGGLFYYYFKGTSTKLCEFKSRQRYVVKEDKCKAGAGFHTHKHQLRAGSPPRVSTQSPSKSDSFHNILDNQRAERYPTPQQSPMSEHNRGHHSARHPVPVTLPAEKSCQRGGSLICSSQISLFLDPLEAGSASFPPPNPLPSALATQRCLCQQKEKLSHTLC